jgi:hypothetical protein
MAMITVNKVLHEGSVKRLALDPKSTDFNEAIKKLKRELETKPNGQNALVVKTATGDVLRLEQDRKSPNVFKTGAAVMVNGQAATVLFREVERPKLGEAFFGGAKWGLLMGAPLAFITGLLEAGKGGLGIAGFILALFGGIAGLMSSSSALTQYNDR